MYRKLLQQLVPHPENFKFTFIPPSYLVLPGWRRRAPGPGAHTPSPLPPAHGPALLGSLTGAVLLRRLREEIGGHQAPDTVDLAHVEAVVIHLAVDVDDLAGAEAQFYLQLGRKGFGRALSSRKRVTGGWGGRKRVFPVGFRSGVCVCVCGGWW